MCNTSRHTLGCSAVVNAFKHHLKFILWLDWVGAGRRHTGCAGVPSTHLSVCQRKHCRVTKGKQGVVRKQSKWVCLITRLCAQACLGRAERARHRPSQRGWSSSARSSRAIPCRAWFKQLPPAETRVERCHRPMCVVCRTTRALACLGGTGRATDGGSEHSLGLFNHLRLACPRCLDVNCPWSGPSRLGPTWRF